MNCDCSKQFNMIMVYDDTDSQPSKPGLTNISVSDKWCSKMTTIHEVTTSNAVSK
jgi:hypothetical protein